jgi:hypothetical protein
MNKSLKNNAFIMASGHILYEPLPSDWEKLDVHELDSFLEEHAWLPFEGYHADELYKMIEDLAETLISFGDKFYH